MNDFWTLARLMLHRRGTLLGAAACACLSAGGLGAGLLGIAPILDVVLGKGQDLPGIVREWSLRLPEALRPGPALYDALPEGRFTAVVIVVAALGVLTVLGAAANFLHQYLALTVVSSTVGAIRVRAFEHVVHLPLRTLLGTGIGAKPGAGAASTASGTAADSVSRIINDSTALGSGFNALLSKALPQVTKGFAALLVALILNWKVAGVALLVAPALAWVIRTLGKRIRRATRAALQGQAGLYHAAAEVLRGLRVVKVHTTEDAETERFRGLSDTVVRQEFRVRTARALSSPLVETLAIIVLGTLVLVAAKAIIDGKLEPTEFILVIGALGVAGASLKPLTSLWSDIQQAGAAATRLRELLDLTGEARAGTPGSLPLPRHAQSIAFEGVTLRYPGAASPAVADLSLRIPHGSTVAFVGPNGSGKTSLLSLIPRLFEPESGRVCIDEIDIARVDLGSLRRQIGVVTQDTVLFKGAIRANIAYGMPGATDERIRQAARRAHAEEFILARPGGYESELSEDGGGLSGGQRQRIAIARAILRDPAILILDEATSMIDAESEHHIAAAIDEFVSHAPGAARRTCLIVAHRLSTVMHADLIVVMEAGRLADAGTHDELMARCALYRSLAQHQLVSGAGRESTPSATADAHEGEPAAGAARS